MKPLHVLAAEAFERMAYCTTMFQNSRFMTERQMWNEAYKKWKSIYDSYSSENQENHKKKVE